MATTPRTATPSKPRGKYRVTPLRQAQRDLTRSLIRDAARDLFYEQHVDLTTMEQIAKRAGMRRSSIYLHYKDKSALLADIIADYIPRAEAQMATMPGPTPSIEQLYRWIGGLKQFFDRERIPLSIIVEAGRYEAVQAHISDLVQHILLGLGQTNPAFRRAAEATTRDLEIRAHAVLLVQQLDFVGQAPQRASPRAWTAALQRALAQSLHDFLKRYD